jgi:hypothetical protein
MPGPGEVPIDDFLEAEQAAESANSGDTPEQFLTRLRQLYYPGTDPAGLTFREIFFDQLMINAPVRSPDGTRRVLTSAGMNAAFFDRLAARAFENASPPQSPDNPSPYVIDLSGARVDIGHVLLTVDAIFHPDAGLPFNTFGIPPIDPASWVADLGTAAVWTEKDGRGTPDAPRRLPPDVSGNPDFLGYFRMSAPDTDLTGDIDGFNIASLWIGSGGNLSTVLVDYYLDLDAHLGGYRRRFRTFITEQLGDPDDPATWRINRSLWEKRINRFNDLIWAGVFGSLLSLSPPPLNSWTFTPAALDTFFAWLEEGVNVEKDTFP